MTEINPHITLILAILRARFEALYGERLHKMLLYGSQARGDAEDCSDIDVMVVLEGEVNPFAEIDRTIDITASLSLEYDVVISCVHISRERYEREKSPLLINVRHDGILV